MMTFHNAETSIASGQPVRLYEFRRDISSWLYTSTDRDITHKGQTYKTLPGGVIDSGVKQTGQPVADVLKITAGPDFPPAQLFRLQAPSAMLEVTIYALHHGVDDFVVIYSGEVRSVQFMLDKSILSCAALSGRIAMQGLRLGWERGCPHALYSTSCGVPLGQHRVAARVQALDGAAINSTEFGEYGAGYFTGGFIEWKLATGDIERRGILLHDGTRCQLLGGTAGLQTGQPIDVFPGCAQTTEACINKFNNLANYGGFPHMAANSPYDINIF